MKHKYLNIQKDKHNIKCKLYTQDNNVINEIVIYGHGFAGHKDTKAAERLALKLTAKNHGYALLSFDLPSHGDDVKKRITLEDCITYLDHIIYSAKNDFKAQKIYMNATSFGGFLTLLYLRDYGNPFDRIVLRCPAINMYKIISSSLIKDDDWEKLGKGKDALIGFDRKVNINQEFLDSLEKINLNESDFIDYADDILIVQGTKDEIIPISDTSDFCENNVIEFIQVKDADHRFKDLQKLEYANALTIDFFMG